MKSTVLFEIVLSCLYLFNVLALPLNHLNFWLLTLTFMASATEVWFGASLFRWVVLRLHTHRDMLHIERRG